MTHTNNACHISQNNHSDMDLVPAILWSRVVHNSNTLLSPILVRLCNKHIHAFTIILNKAIMDADAMPATTVKELIEKIEK
jgi:hypothetical protein